MAKHTPPPSLKVPDVDPDHFAAAVRPPAAVTSSDNPEAVPGRHYNAAMHAAGWSFTRLYELGWPDLLPAIPPDSIAQAQVLAGELPASMLGKAPGKLVGHGPDRMWVPFKGWREAPFTRAHAAQWDAWHASIAMRTEKVAALDVDIMDPEASAALQLALFDRYKTLAERHRDKIRVGQAPKWAMLFRTSTPARSWVMEFVKGGQHGLIELRGARHKIMIAGKHQNLDCYYRWGAAPRGFADFLPQGTDEAFDVVRGLFADVMIGLGWKLKEQSRQRDEGPAPPQESLKAPDAAEALALIARTPNKVAAGRAEYVRIAAAIRGALQGVDEDVAEEAWSEFAMRWTLGEADEDDVRRTWASLHPPYRVGWDTFLLYAQKHGDTTLTQKAYAGLPEAERARAEAEKRAQAAALFEGWDSGPAKATPPSLQGVVVPGYLSEGVRPQEASERAQWSAQALAARWAAQAPECAFVSEAKAWRVFNGKVWARDPEGVLVQGKISRWLVSEAGRARHAGEDPKEAKRLAHELLGPKMPGHVSALARPTLLLPMQAFDDPTTCSMVFNTPEGLLDLTDGKLYAHQPVPRLTRMSGCRVASDDARPVRWLTFLEEITQGDDELVAWLQRAVGYTLTGSLRDAVFFFLYGSGGNGKSVFLNVLRRIMGDYATVADQSVFIRSRSNDHSTTKASLAGARMVLVPEVATDAHWNDGMLKQFTSGDPVKARFLYQDEFTYLPEGTLWFSGNERPTLQRVDPSIERRFRFITFDFMPEKPDRTLESRLWREEGPAILRWAVQGCMQWQRDGLGECSAVARSTSEYLAAVDPLHAFIRDVCVVEDNARETVSDLMTAFERYKKGKLEFAGSPELSTVHFARRVRSLLGDKSREARVGGDDRRRILTGLRLKVKLAEAG